MTLQDLLATIPYGVWHDVRVDADDGDEVILSVSFRPELANYAGTFHAGALYTLAETVAGVVADRAVPGERAYVLLRSAQINYTRRPEGDVIAAARKTETDAAAALKDFETSGRADIAVDVSMKDSLGESVFAGRFDYALRPRKAGWK